MKRAIPFLMLISVGCSPKPKQNIIHITLVNNQRSVQFTGLDRSIISDIGRDTTKGIWENLVPVYRMPVDTDMKSYQPVQHGTYQIKDSLVIFTPDTPFVKNQVYFTRYYQFDRGGKTWDMITGKKPPGPSHYIDLVFKRIVD
ncbi:hypothetical protein BH09BAC6_BH09BAC6_19770 [soil metagenome]|jgi:hypothetical protein